MGSVGSLPVSEADVVTAAGIATQALIVCNVKL